MTDIVRDPYGNPLKRDATIDALRAENERLRAALEKAEALQDSAYNAGVGAGWNAAQNPDPVKAEAEFAALRRNKEYLKVLKDHRVRATLASVEKEKSE